MELWHQIILVFIVTFCAAFTQRVTGFGFGIVAMLFFPHIIGAYAPATLLSNMLSVAMSLSVVIANRKDIRLRLIFPSILGGLVTTFLAVQFMKGMTSALLSACLGAFLILLSVYFIFFSSKIRIKPTIPMGVAMGSISGVLGGLFSTGGPPMVIYLLSATESMAVYVATMQGYFAVMNSYNIVVKTVAGFMTERVLICAAFGVIGSVSASFVGSLVAKRINAAKLKKVIYGFMAVSGLITLLSALGVI